MQVSVWRVALIPYSLLREEDHRGEDTVNDSVLLSLSTALSLFIVVSIFLRIFLLFGASS